MKKVKVNYPRKSTRLHIDDFFAAEPERKSMYQVMKENLKAFNRVTFLHRIIYVGEHKFKSFDEARKLFDRIIKKCNDSYCMEKLSGFFLYYNQYFVHMVEGDEDNVNKHLGLLLDKSEYHFENLGVIKLLVHVSNINQRFLEDWIACTGAPSKFLEKFDINANLQTQRRWIYNCIKKIYSLIGTFGEYLLTTEVTEPPTGSKINLETSNTVVSSQGSSSMFHSSFSHNNTNSGPTGHNIYARTSQGEFKNFLPEYELLDFVIKSNFTIFLQEYFQLYRIIPMRDIYKDKVWPIPHDFIPFDIFEKPYDCAIELPKDLRKTEHKEMTLSPNISSSLVSNIGTDIDVQMDNTVSIQYVKLYIIILESY
ncbi:uncharacterized protein [Euwallacea similis]|uniref:uncharacterized protein n=1 Tax=Euwallacea similis TaxID=1736056 RepID=UPI00344F2D9A